MFDEIVLSLGFNKLVQKSCLIHCVVHGLVFHLCVMVPYSRVYDFHLATAVPGLTPKQRAAVNTPMSGWIV